MKKRDCILFAFPIAGAVFTIAFAVFLFKQTVFFSKAYTDEAEDNIAQYVRLASAVVTPLLNAGEINAAAGFCEKQTESAFRLTLIDPSGAVVADSSGERTRLGNHADRAEVASALAGRESGAVRYSASLGRGMIYYALPVSVNGGIYVLRGAMSTERVGRIIDFAEINVILSLLFGAFAVSVLSLYIIKRVRRPLAALQKSVEAVAGGDLSHRIDIPRGDIVHELAIGVSEMTEQLKSRLAEVTAERNERVILFNTMSEGVLLFAADGSLVRANRAGGAIFSVPEGGKPYNLSRCRINGLSEAVRVTFKTGESFEREFSLEGSGFERPRSLLIRGGILEEDSQRRVLLTVTELTGLRRLESFRSDFVADVSHEIKTPLTCILGAAEALEEDELPEEQRKRLLEILRKQSKRLNGLVRDILSLAALEKGEYNVKGAFVPMDLGSVAVNAVNSCLSFAQSKGIMLSISESEELEVYGDPQLLEQALVNLIENALRYSEAANVDVLVKKSGTSAVMEVSDNGIGIPLNHQKRIFERFYRVDKSRSRELGGTGLGLAIVKHTALLHGGTAEVESESGKGARFRIKIPLKNQA